MNETEVKEALRLIGERYKKDWVFYVEHGLGFWTWSKMREIIRSVQENRKTIVVSCHGSSKTFTAALITLIFLQIYYTFNREEETSVVTTAPGFRQVKDLLWRRINEIFKKSRTELQGECLQTEIKTEKSDCFATGFSTDTADAAEGWHSWNQLFILDEGKGIAPWMWDMVKAQMGGGNSKVLVLSTTDGIEPGSEFHNAATSPLYAEWNRIFIDCKELPSFTGEKLRRYKWNDSTGFDFEREEKTYEDLRIQISTPLWEEENKKQWGKDSVLYLTKCRGQIVDELPDQIIPLWKVEKMYANYEDPNFDDTGTEEVGIDAARMGKDSSCGWRRKGMKFFPPARLNKKEAYEVIDHYEKVGILTSKDIKIKNDDTGVGGAVTGDLKRRGYTNVVPVCFNQEPNDKDHYEMAIDEMWFTFEEVMQDYACPRNDQLTKQLTSRKSTKMTKRGQRKVEPKDDYKARMGGESCDEADGLLLAWYTPVKKEKEGGFEIPDVRIY